MEYAIVILASLEILVNSKHVSMHAVEMDFVKRENVYVMKDSMEIVVKTDGY